MANATITGYADKTVKEDALQTTSGTLTVTDADKGEAHTTAATGVHTNYGVWSVDTNGNWTYKINNSDAAIQSLGADDHLTDSFVITSQDGSASKTVHITINGTNDPATMSGLNKGSVTEDLDPTASGTLTVSDKDNGQAHTVASSGAGNQHYGTYSVDADGQWSYAVDNGNATVQALAAGQTLTDTFTVSSQDGTASKTVTITINGSNDVATIDTSTAGDKATGSVTEDGTLTDSGHVTVTDVDNGQAHTAAMSAAASTNGYGTWSVDTDGHWTYNLDNSNSTVQALGAGQTLTDTFTITSQDGTGSEVVTITINGTADSTTITGKDTGTVQEDVTLTTTGTLTVNDSTPGESHTQAKSGTSTYGSWSVDTDGHWSYNLNNGNSAVQALPTSGHLTDSFIVTSQDGSATDTVTITINGNNDAASIVSSTFAKAVVEDATLTSTGNITFRDPDTGEAHATVVTNGPAAHGTYSVDTDGNWSYKLNNSDSDVQGLGAGQNMKDTFTVKSQDGTSSAVVTITINGVNDAAVITGQAKGTVIEDSGTDATGTLTVTDKDAGQSHSKAASGASASGYGTYTVDADGHWNYHLNDANPTVDALKNGQTLTDSFTVKSQDGNTSKVVNVTINGSNDAPHAQSSSFTLAEDGSLSNHVTATDVEHDTLHYSVSGAAGHGSVSMNDDGSFTYNPTADYHGPDSFTYTVTDGDKSDTATVSLTVTSVNDAPTQPVDTNGDATNNNIFAGATAGTPVGITVHSTDVDGDSLTYSLTDNAGGRFAIDPTTGEITVASGAPTIGQQDYTVTAVANDGTVNSAPQTFTIHAGPLVVDATGANGAFTTIQAAVNAAAGLHGPVNIVVHAGTYQEQVEVTGHTLDGLNISAYGDGTVTVKAPDALHETATTTDNYIGAARSLDGIVTVTTADGVTINGITVDGNQQGDHATGTTGQPQLVGIVYRDASGTISNDHVTGIKDPDIGGQISGAQQGMGVYVYNNPVASTGNVPDSTTGMKSVEMSHTTIDGFQKNGAVFWNSEVNIHDNTVTGAGLLTGDSPLAQNGIEVFSSTGTVAGNTISGIDRNSPDGVGPSGILVYYNRNLDITGNTIHGAGSDNLLNGIYVEGGAGAVITGNNIDHTDSPIQVYDLSGIGDGVNFSGGSLTDDATPNAIFDPGAASTVDFTVNGSAGTDELHGGAGTDHLMGNDGNDVLDGRDGGDTLEGGQGDDQLDGGKGADAMTGGDGDDTYTVDNSSDTVTEGSGANSGTDSVNSSIDYTLTTNVENLTLTGTAIHGTGNDLGNEITGNASNNVLEGKGGNDTIDGGAGTGDTAVFTGAMSEYSITFNGGNGTITVADNNPTARDGTDTLSNVENLQFGATTVLIVDHTGQFGQFTTIQSAVDAAASLSGPTTIVVRGGEYDEQVVVDATAHSSLSGLTIQGATGETVTVAPPAGTLALTANSPTSGRDYDGLITVKGGHDVTIQNVSVDGKIDGAHLNASGATMAGIVYVNSDNGHISHVDVTGIRQDDSGFGVQANVGIAVLNSNPSAGLPNTPTSAEAALLNNIEIDHTTVTNFQKTGIQVSYANVDIHDNHVTGIGATGLTAQNGIQVSGSTGNVYLNHVDGLGYTHDQTVATAILTFETQGLHIHDNTIVGTDPNNSTIGIASEDSEGTTITGNNISLVQYPIDIEDYPTSWSYPDALKGGTYDLSSNTIDDTTGAYLQADAASTEAFHVTGTDHADIIITGAGADVIDGGNGDDLIDGGAGIDQMHGGQGDDTFMVNNSNDQVTEDNGQGTDTVNSTADYTLGNNVENLNLLEGTTQTITFDETDDNGNLLYAPGKITDGENGWKLQDQTLNQQVVDTGDDQHGQAWHIINNPTTGNFGSMPFTPELSIKTGEPGVPGAQTNNMTYSLDFMAAGPAGDGSRLEIDFANSQGGDRNNFLILENTADGVRVLKSDPDTSGNFSGNQVGAFGSDYETLTDHVVPGWHNLQLQLVANPGANNDVINVYVDGTFVGSTTTWENYHDALGGTHESNAADYLMDRMIFRLSNPPGGNPTDPEDRQGFLIDNITTSAGAPVIGIGNGDDNVINGNSTDNQLSGLGGNDHLNGGLGFDTLTGGGGNDALDGGAGKDTAVFSSSSDEYGITLNGDGTITVTDKNTTARDGTDTLTSVENLHFTDATVLIVDQSGATSPYTTIQSAVDAAQSIDGPVTILVGAGTYQEQVVDDGKSDLTIKALALNTVTVLAPDALVETTILPDNALGQGARSMDGIVTVKNADNVTIDGIKVDGNHQGDHATGTTGTPQLIGILFHNASGTISNDTVTGTKAPDPVTPGQISGGQQGMGVYVFNDTPVNPADIKSIAMTASHIDGFQKNGAVFWNSDVTITGNVITGAGLQTGTPGNSPIAQNGIEVFGSTGIVHGNTVQNIDRADVDENGSPSAILAYFNNDLQITDNTIHGLGDTNQLNGIYLFESVGATVTGNHIDNAATPIEVDEAAGQGSGINFSGNDFSNDASPNTLFDPGAGNAQAFDITGSDGSDTVLYYNGNGHEAFDGGNGTDTVEVDHADAANAATAATFDISGTAGADPVVIKVYGTEEVSATHVEEIKLDLGSGGDTVTIHSLDGTSVATSTITVSGGEGADTVDAGEIDAAHAVGVHFDGGAGEDSFTGGAGNDSFTGGGDHDTAVYGGTVDDLTFTFNGSGAGQTLSVTSAVGGTDTLSGVEQLNVGSAHVLIVGAGGYATIQDAVTASHSGDTILVGPGTYSGNLTIDHQVTIMGSGPDTVIQGTFRSDNHIPDGTTTAEYLENAASYTGAAGTGITVAADGVTLKDLAITGFNTGIGLGTNDGLTISNVDISESVMGIFKDTTAAVTHFDLEGGSITDSYQGMIINAAANGSGDFSHVIINGTHFENLTEKGIYAEQLSNATIDGISMENVGEFGRGPAFDNIASHIGGFGAGIDINLKYETYSSIDIGHFTMTNVGHSFGHDGTPDNTGGAILVKARNDGSYAATPAHLTDVTIHDGTINGTGVAIRTGEPGAGDTEPALTINGVVITNADIAQYDNQTHSVTHVTLTDGADTAVAAPGSIGAFDFHAGGGDDHVTGGGGNDTLEGGKGDDSLTGGGGHDTATFSGNMADYTITWTGETATVTDNKGTDGTDTVVGVGTLHFQDHDAILVGKGADADFTTIQSGVDAAKNGDTVLVGEGAFAGNVLVDSKSITIDGAGRGATNTEVDGTITFSGTVNGSAQVGDMIVNAAGHQYGVYVSAGSTGAGGFTLDNVLVENSQTNGFAYILAGNEAAPTHGGTLGNIAITDSEFSGNATVNSGPGGRGDIILFGFNGDVTLDGVQIEDAGVGAQKAIQIRGIDSVSNGGNFNFNNISVNNGNYTKDLMVLANYAGFTSFSATGVDLNATAPWGLIHLDGVGGSVDLSHVTGVNGAADASVGVIDDRSTDDTIFGTGDSDLFRDASGADHFDGKGGNDVFVIGDPSLHPAGESIEGGDGIDTILFADNTDGHLLTLHNVTGVEYATVVDAATGLTTGTHGVGIDASSVVTGMTLTGNEGNNHLTGGSGDDTIYGNGGNDTLDGGAGTNNLYGGKGDDLYFVHSGTDFVHENSTEGTDTVDSSYSGYILPNDVENLILHAGTDALDGTGNGLANTITGNDGDNTISGLGGIDFLDGGKGADHLDGGVGADTLHGGAGDDVMTGGSGADTYQFDSYVDGHDTIADFDANNDRLSFKASLDLDNNGVIDDLNAQISNITDGGANTDVVVTFKDGGSITLEGANVQHGDHSDGKGGFDISTLVADHSQITTH